MLRRRSDSFTVQKGLRVLASGQGRKVSGSRYDLLTARDHHVSGVVCQYVALNIGGKSSAPFRLQS